MDAHAHRRPADRRHGARRRLAQALYVAASLAIVLASAWVVARRVQDPAWPAAAHALRGRVDADEAVLLLPAAARLEARHFDGPGLAVLAALPPDSGTLGGLWVVAGPGHDPGALAALAARYRTVERVPGEGFQLVHLREPLRTAFDLVGRFREARVSRTDTAGRETRCEGLRDGKRICGGPWWHDVGPHTAPFGGEKRRAIWFHPFVGETATLRFDALPAGDRVVVRLALDDDARRVRREKGLGPVVATVRVGAADPIEVALTPEEPQRTLVLARPAGEGDVPLVVSARVADDDHFANLYVSGEVLQ
jgi:hypothetical protein